MIFEKNRRDLNLIPEEQQSLKTRKTKMIATSVIAVVVGLELVVFSSVFVLQSLEQNRQNDLTRQTAQKNAQWQKIATVAASTKTIKIGIGQIKQFPVDYWGVETALDKVKTIMPTGITLSAFDSDKDGKTGLVGLAGSPEIILQFFNKLQSEAKSFTGVKLESINKSDTDYSFRISFKVKK